MMNRILTALGLLTLLTTGSAHARSRFPKADIPFSFHVGDRVLPAGLYAVYPEHGHLWVKCVACEASAVIVTIDAQPANEPAQSKLVFRRYGHAYFLAKVWTQGRAMGRELPPSKLEREFARNRLLAPNATAIVAAS
jgi:hypothetical protein